MKVIIIGQSGVGKTTIESMLINDGYKPFTIYTNSKGHSDQPSHYTICELIDIDNDDYHIYYQRDDGLFYAISIEELRDSTDRIMTSIDMTESLYDLINTHRWGIEYKYIELTLPEGTTIQDRIRNRMLSEDEVKKRSKRNPMTDRQVYLLSTVPKIENRDIKSTYLRTLEVIGYR